MKETFFILLFFLVVSSSFAQEKIKPAISEDKLLSEQEQIQVKKYLSGKIFKELQPAKNDYVDRDNKGTVEFNPRKGTNMLGREVFAASNYSAHKVIIPDGTTVKEVNFAQKNPHTDAIQGKNLTFISCNLNNVEIDESWTLINCLAVHTKKEIVKEGERIYEIQYVEKEGKWIENSRDDITFMDDSK